MLEAAATRKADFVALPALLTVTMPAMRTTVDAFRKAGVRDRVKIIVGGAPVTSNLAEEIGAGGFSDSASPAVNLARVVLKAG